MKTYYGDMKFSQALIGKTILAATQLKHKTYNDEGFLRLDFTDGTYLILEASYGGYTGGSEDEYPTTISIINSVEREDMLKPL